MSDQVQESFGRLLAYCEKESFKGYDPYDGLNSRVFQSLPGIFKNKYSRLLWIQFFKKSPINFRPIAGVKKEYNPKALGLFLSAYCNLYKNENKDEYLNKINFFSKKLLELRSENWSGDSWGYNFDWQARAFFQPKYTPTVVATVFNSCALIDAFEITKEEKLFYSARSSCNFILKDLNRTFDSKGNFAFSYSPLDKTVVYNASLLGSRLLARVYSFTNENELFQASKCSLEYCCDKQHSNGSWSYGEQQFHGWVDNFHTGYNLECINDYIKYTGDNTYSQKLNLGFQYYTKTFFTETGIPKYYNNSIFPVDIHASAQLIITLSKMNHLHDHKNLVNRVLNWTIRNMQNNKGYFYYQKNRLFSSKIPFMRWAQAWMFYALSEYLLHNNE